MEKIVILANRLAESILMNWDDDEVIKLAKEVAVACKENIDFISLVKRMREAQKGIYQAFTTSPKAVVDWSVEKARQLESEVDEYLKKMEYGVDRC